MKIGHMPQDGKVHIYCLRCKHETVREKQPNIYTCTSCDFVSRRALIIDPTIKWWRGDDDEYWHEAAGVFVRNPQDKFLFLERAKYPSGFTIPMGHVDRGEMPVRAAQRELFEETNIQLPLGALKLVMFDNIRGDKCRRGSDAHRWDVYAATMPPNAAVKVNRSESKRAEWLTLEEALRRDLPPALRLVIKRHDSAILRSSR